MSRGHESPRASYEMLVGQIEQELPVRYTIPFEWGNLKVTEGAHQAYQLTPLVAGVLTGDATPEGSPTQGAVEVRLVGPSEFDTALTDEVMTQGFVLALPTESGVRMDIGSIGDNDSNIDYVKSMVKEEFDVTDADIEENIVDEDGVSVAESIEQGMTQFMVHQISNNLGETLSKSYAKYLRHERSKVTSRDMTRVVAVGFGGTALVAAAVLGRDPYVDVAGVGIIATYLGLTRGVIKRMMEFIDASEDGIQDMSSSVANHVAQDIHDAYCTKHFDAQAESMLDGDESDG